MTSVQRVNRVGLLSVVRLSLSPSPLPSTPFSLSLSLSLSVSFAVAFSSHLKRKVKGDDEGMGDRLQDALLLEHLVDVTATENVVLRVRVYMWIEDRRAEV